MNGSTNSALEIERYAAFTENGGGGNPAGVVICETLPDAAVMQRIAADVGYSETVFAAPDGPEWRVRYFAPTMEVPFCGHATIALGIALAQRSGDGIFSLRLNTGTVRVEGRVSQGAAFAQLWSPPTHSGPVDGDFLAAALGLFGLSGADLDPRLRPAMMHAGANHLLIAVATREALGSMAYELEAGRRVMALKDLATICLVHAETPILFHARNPFAAGGVYEDPATGAAAAALGGYLRDIAWPHGGRITVLQGEDMGQPCRLTVGINASPGASVTVSGTVRRLST